MSDGSEFTPMSTTMVPPRPARCSSSDVGERRVARDDGEEVADAAVRERDAGGAGHRDGARDAGDHLDGHAGAVAGEHLLAAAAEHVRVAALQAHDVAAGERVLDEQRLDLVLRDGVVAGALADVDELGRRGELGEAPRSGASRS